MQNKQSSNHRWSGEEIQVLINAVQTNGHRWKTISDLHFPQLNAQTIKNKYYSQFKDKQKYSQLPAVYIKWTEQDIYNMFLGIKQFGNKWKKIQINYLPNMSIQNIKNKYHSSSKEHNQSETSKLLKQYVDNIEKANNNKQNQTQIDDVLPQRQEKFHFSINMNDDNSNMTFNEFI